MTDKQFINSQTYMGNGFRIGKGRLMSPAQVREATHSHGPEVSEELGRSWALCGEVSDELFEALRCVSLDNLTLGVTLFDSPGGGEYAVMTQQLLDKQHRFLLPLWDPEAAAFWQSIQHAPFNVSLSTTTGDMAVVLPHVCYPLPGEVNRPLRTSQTTAQRALALLAELPMLMQALCESDAVQSLGALREVNVSVVPPAQALLAASAPANERGESPLH